MRIKSTQKPCRLLYFLIQFETILNGIQILTHSHSMADGIIKADKDFSKDADKQIPEAEALAKVRASCSF